MASRHQEPLPIRTIWHFVRPHAFLAGLALAALVGAAAFEGSAMALFVVALETVFGNPAPAVSESVGPMGPIFEQVFGRLDRQGAFVALVLLAVGIQVVRSALDFGAACASAHLQAAVFKDVWNKVFGQIMAMSFAQVSRYKGGDLNQYVWDANVMYQVIQQLNELLGNMFIIVVYLLFLLWLSWPLTLVAVVAILLLSKSVGGIVRKIRAIAEESLPARIAMGNRCLEFLSALRLIRTFAREPHATEQMNAVVDDAMRQTRRRALWMAVLNPIMNSSTVLGVGGFLLLGYLIVGQAGRAALPQLLMFLFIVYRLLPRAGGLNQERASLQDLFPLVRRVSEILRTDDKEYTVSGSRPFVGFRRGIVFKDVSLKYIEGEREAVTNLTFDVPRGSMVALVGESGAGKSTVADLLLRLYDPTSGQILIDDVDLRDLDLASWRSHIGVVSQDTFVFNASIRDNITFGRLDASEAEVVAAATAAHAHGFIMELEAGYDTIIGDRGYRLSGGQRQRIAIARAILRDPEFFVFDEATSDLDSRSERLIQDAQERLRKDRTVVAIAHRLSTVAGADQILVLDRGAIVERGTHEELLAIGGLYAQYWRLQSESGRDERRYAAVALEQVQDELE